ncbi:MAG: hypothetical protein NTY61_01670 [Candidatus Parcubacteria bacterium]|nr:hypothetical protein [Candidatus Parcubacteria bacterium]
MFGKKLTLRAAIAVLKAIGAQKTAETAPVAMAYMKAIGIPVTIGKDIERFFARIKVQKAQIAAVLQRIRQQLQALETKKAKRG